MAENAGGYPSATGPSDEQPQQLSSRTGRPKPAAGTPLGSARPSTAPSSGGNRLQRSPSPRDKARINVNELDHRKIMALSQTCTEDLTAKMREKNALSDLLSELKKKKMQYDARGGKKKREVDTTVVQTMEMEKKLQQLNNSNKMMTAELTGLRKDNEILEAEVEDLRRGFKEASLNYEKESADVEKVKRMLYNYRKEINAEAKLRDNVQQDLRASRTAQSLMINRLDDMEKRNRALRSCVANTFNG